MAKRRIIRPRDLPGPDAPDGKAPRPRATEGDPSGVEFVGGPIGKLTRLDAVRDATVGGLRVPTVIRVTIELPPIPAGDPGGNAMQRKLAQARRDAALAERFSVVDFLNSLVGKEVILGYEPALPADDDVDDASRIG